MGFVQIITFHAEAIKIELQSQPFSGKKCTSPIFDEKLKL
jgi:hypothetical protein